MFALRASIAYALRYFHVFPSYNLAAHQLSFFPSCLLPPALLPPMFKHLDI
ncbi:MAG: hypothetical protein F6K47_20565 [Symploca sp. SIO2E6]|nr:hypothetical protein [Symploca sp. SIO2E6]